MDLFSSVPDKTAALMAFILLCALVLNLVLMLVNHQHRKKAEAALLRTRDRYLKIFDTTTVALLEQDCLAVKQAVDQVLEQAEGDPAGFLEARPDVVEQIIAGCRITDANPAAVRLFKAPDKQTLIDAYHDLFLPETKSALKEILIAMGTGQTRFEGETTLRTMDNEILHVLLSLTLPAEPEAYGHIIGSFVDITDRHRSQEALCISEDRFRTVFNHAASGMALLDLNGNYFRVNQSLCNLLGYTENELSQMNWRDVTHPEDIPAARDATTQALEGRILAPIENRYIDRQGRIVWVLLSLARIADQDQKPLYYVAQMQDITTLRNAREKLRQKEERYRQIFEADLSGFYIVNPKGTLLMCNHVFARILGYGKAADLLGKNFKTFYEDQRVRSRLVAELASTRKVIHREVTLVKKDGTPIHVLLNAIGRFDSRGRLLEVQGYLMDLTLQKNLETQLLHAQKMESIGTMAGGVAHDFNNLLMGIMGHISLLQLELDKDHPSFGRLKSIEQFAQSGSYLTRQLLGFAKGGTYEVRPLNMNQLIERNSQMFARTRKEIRVQTRLTGNLWPVEADANQIDQVLYNLYLNAWQAMQKGGDLSITTQNVILGPEEAALYGKPAGAYVKISVADTGVGMSAEIQQRIFDPFFTTKSRGRGTGLGLASAYGIIKNHDGFISVQSAEGAGATFCIHLPVSKTTAAYDVSMPPAQEGPAVKGSGTLLLVDDEDVVIEAVGDMLSHLGYRLHTAQSGRQALDLYIRHQNEIDLVILDLVMPGMGGAETYQKLKTVDPGIKVLLCSGFSAEDQAAQLLKRGCIGFIQKPFTMNQLSVKLDEVLNGQAA